MRKVLYILGQLSDEDIEWMIGVGGRLALAPGTTLIREGSPISALYIVVDGALAISAGGREVARLGAGEIVGEMSFVENRPPSATVTALVPSVVFVLDRDRLSARLERDGPFAARFYRAVAMFLSDRLRSTVGRLGYGEVHEQPTSADDLDDLLLDTIHLAGARFERILHALSAG